MSRFRYFMPSVLLTLLTVPALAAQVPARPFVPVTDHMLEHPEPGDWLSWRATPNGWGFSPLQQINSRNVRDLRLVWSRALAPGTQETTPLVYAGVMYLANPNDIIQSIDAATGDLKWEYRRALPRDLNDYFVAPPGAKRNIAIFGKQIISAGGDAVLFALDAESGKLTWETPIIDYKKGALQSSGPIIAGGRIISGRSCEPFGGPEVCVITAHDALTGAELWRTRTVPGPGEPGDASWGGIPYEMRRHVSAWMPASYDPALDLIIVGTSVTSPAPKFMLAGNDKTYLYHNSTLALDGNSGKIRWYYQHLVDHWDMDHTFERILVDSKVVPDARSVPWRNERTGTNERRPVVTGVPGKSGLVYTLDRRTGEFLWARPTIHQNLVTAIDGTSGKVHSNPEVLFGKVGDERLVCPSSHGGKDWQAGAYSPLTNAMYFPMQNTCMVATAITPRTKADSFYAISRRFQLAPNAVNLGAIHAISVETGRNIWTFETRSATASLVATGGGLLFGGDGSGRFRAFDQRTGRVLWEINLGSPIAGFPVSYAVAGRQYIAVTTGRSGHTGAFARLAGELPTASGNNVFVFALPDRR